MAFCTFCGTQVPDDIKFCTSCGKPMGITVKVPAQPVQPVQQVQPQAPSPPPQPQQAPSVYAQPQTAPPPQQAYTVPPAQPYAAQPYAAQPYAPAPRPERPAPGQQVRTDHDRRIYRHHVADDATHRQPDPAPCMGMRRLPESE